MIRKTRALVEKPKRFHLYRILTLAALICNASTAAQEIGHVIVSLQINQPYEQPMMVSWIEFDELSSESRAGTKRAAVRRGHLPGGLKVAVETSAEPLRASVRVDTNGNGDLADELPLLIEVDSSVMVNVTRRWTTGKTAKLPYNLSYKRTAEGRDFFYWRPGYAADGKLKVGKCEADIKVLDVNGDGVFDRGDFTNATTIHIDDGTAGDAINLNDPRVIRHSDGRIEIPPKSIKRKWLKGEELIEFCEGFFLIDRIEPDGSRLTLARTKMKVPRIGETLPAFVMNTLSGESIDTKSLKGTVTLLDFWASWCRPCVEKFGDLKQILKESKGGTRVIAINVDDSEQLPQARQVIKEYELTWPQIASGRGEGDPLWKAFGSMSANGLSVPLYVLVDSNGIITYAGNGGEHLLELRAKVKELERKP